MSQTWFKLSDRTRRRSAVIFIIKWILNDHWTVGKWEQLNFRLYVFIYRINNQRRSQKMNLFWKKNTPWGSQTGAEMGAQARTNRQLSVLSNMTLPSFWVLHLFLRKSNICALNSGVKDWWKSSLSIMKLSRRQPFGLLGLKHSLMS